MIQHILRIVFSSFQNKKGRGFNTTAFKQKKPWAVARPAHGSCNATSRAQKADLPKKAKAKEAKKSACLFTNESFHSEINLTYLCN